MKTTGLARGKYQFKISALRQNIQSFLENSCRMSLKRDFNAAEVPNTLNWLENSAFLGLRTKSTHFGKE